MYFLGVLLLVFNTGLGKTATPMWNPTYTVKGTLNLPLADIIEQFNAWYDEPAKQSRIDYYGGMVKTYQMGSFGGYGTVFKIVPATTKNETNITTCFQDCAHNIPQRMMPVLDDFHLVGQETMNGISAEKWQLVETNEQNQRDDTYTMWLHYRNDTDQLRVKVPVPVRYEKRGYNTESKGLSEHYYLDYVSYDTSEIPIDTFTISKDLQCSGLPYSNIINPMAEYIRPETTTHVDSEFEKFKKNHSKTYDSKTEHSRRKDIFRQNLRFINSHNHQGKGYTLAINHLADRTDLELKALRGRLPSVAKSNGSQFPHEEIDGAQLPTELNWQMRGAVTPVKNQAICGSCWAFAASGAVEGAHFLKTGNLLSLSPQALMDCSWGNHNNGCEGGLANQAYEWMMNHGGIPTEEAYGPYLAQDGYCHVDNAMLKAKIAGYEPVRVEDETALRHALVNHGPVSVAIDASRRSFRFYSHGVYYEPNCSSQKLDHAVLAVGYGTTNGKNYWLIKNSWSSSWGNDGYILMASKDNNCGVMSDAYCVTM